MLPSLHGFEAQPRIRMDVSETDQAAMIKADIPGVKKDDIKVSIDGGTVSILAEMKKEKAHKMVGNMMHSERYDGEQYRSITLPKKAGATSKPITIP